MTGHDYIALAKRLLADAEEASWRSAVSRAYYGAFHLGIDFFTALCFRVPQSDRAHSYLWMRLQNCGVAALVAAGSDLNELRSRRNEADYHFRRPVSRAKAAHFVATAEAVVAALDAASVGPVPAAAVQAAVARYERDVSKDVTFRP